MAQDLELLTDVEKDQLIEFIQAEVCDSSHCELILKIVSYLRLR